MKCNKWFWPLQLAGVALQLGGMLIVRPRLWRTAVTQVFRMAATGWWRKPPYLPLPSREYLHFRISTMYGGDGNQIPYPGDFVHYLEWCHNFPGPIH